MEKTGGVVFFRVKYFSPTPKDEKTKTEIEKSLGLQRAIRGVKETTEWGIQDIYFRIPLENIWKSLCCLEPDFKKFANNFVDRQYTYSWDLKGYRLTLEDVWGNVYELKITTNLAEEWRDTLLIDGTDIIGVPVEYTLSLAYRLTRKEIMKFKNNKPDGDVEKFKRERLEWRRYHLDDLLRTNEKYERKVMTREPDGKYLHMYLKNPEIILMLELEKLNDYNSAVDFLRSCIQGDKFILNPEYTV